MSDRVIWIAPGCIECFWCQQLAGDVFTHGDNGTEIRGEARKDGKNGPNRREKSPLVGANLSAAESVFLQFVADGCPVQVIKLDGNWATLGLANPA